MPCRPPRPRRRGGAAPTSLSAWPRATRARSAVPRSSRSWERNTAWKSRSPSSSGRPAPPWATASATSNASSIVCGTIVSAVCSRSQGQSRRSLTPTSARAATSAPMARARSASRPGRVSASGSASARRCASASGAATVASAGSSESSPSCPGVTGSTARSSAESGGATTRDAAARAARAVAGTASAAPDPRPTTRTMPGLYGVVAVGAVVVAAAGFRLVVGVDGAGVPLLQHALAPVHVRPAAASGRAGWR